MLNILIELQRLKRLNRTGWALRGLPNGTESVASHSFGVILTAMMLAAASPRIDLSIDSPPYVIGKKQQLLIDID